MLKYAPSNAPVVEKLQHEPLQRLRELRANQSDPLLRDVQMVKSQ